jgi:sulfotransferase family protein
MPEQAKTGWVRPRQLAPPRPPACPSGWVTAPPDFVGVGAQRCGTTWWFRQIVLHPGVFFDEGVHRKEVHYFDSLSGVDALSPEQAALYERYFPRPAHARLVGEWTPRYLYDPWVAAQLAQAAPRARVLVMLRDPVERYVSGVRWQSRLLDGSGGGTVPTLEMIVEQQRRRSLYAQQVRRLLEAFPREQVLVLQYERCRDRYAEELERTYGFLGLEHSFRPAPDGNAPETPREGGMPDAERADMAREYAADVKRLVEIVPEIDPSLWPSVRDLV